MAQICETCKWKGARCYCAPNSTCEGYEPEISYINTTTQCPKCGAGLWNIWCYTTLLNGPGNITTYNCNNCGHSWRV